VVLPSFVHGPWCGKKTLKKKHHPGDKTKSYVCRSDGTFTEKSSLKKIKTRFFGL
jgi:hypothetical protein